MWYSALEPGHRWEALWYDYIICKCGGIRRVEGKCPVCAAALVNRSREFVRFEDGRELAFPADTYAGAEARYEDYLYLNMMEREWRRPTFDSQPMESAASGGVPSERSSIVVLYWSYFESRFERLLRAGMRELSPRLTEDLLARYGSIGARMDRLYGVLFETSFRADLASFGFDQIAQHIGQVQERRNSFAHGEPAAIDDALVTSVVENLQQEHEAWIAVFNRRTVRNGA